MSGASARNCLLKQARVAKTSVTGATTSGTHKPENRFVTECSSVVHAQAIEAPIPMQMDSTTS